MNAYSMHSASEVQPSVIAEMHDLPHVARQLNKPTIDDIERRSQRASSRDFVAMTSDGQAVGLLLLNRVDSWIYEILRIVAVREHEGIGSFMLGWALHYAFDVNKAHRAFLEVPEQNTRARRLYESFGFLQEGTYRDGFRSPISGRFENLCPYGLLESDYYRRIAAANQTFQG